MKSHKESLNNKNQNQKYCNDKNRVALNKKKITPEPPPFSKNWEWEEYFNYTLE